MQQESSEKDQQSPPKKRKYRFLRTIWGTLPYLFVIGLVVFIAMTFGRIQTEKNRLAREKAAQIKSQAPEINVVTLEMIPSPIRDRINLPGSVMPWVKLNVLAEVNAKVIEKPMEEGMIVEVGDVLAQLDSRDYKNTYQSAKASYEVALASKKRLEKLHNGMLSTRSQLEDAIGLVENYKAAMDTAALDVDRCTIRAPISGVVNQVFIDIGQYVSRSDPVVEILQIERVKVIVGIPESDVEAVRKLQYFDVSIDALGGKTFQAQKYFLSKTADTMARLYNLELAVDNSHAEILPDMFVRVEIVKREIPKSLSIPLYAVISRNNESFVYVVNGGTAHARKVELGVQEEWRVQVTKGLEAGDKVIVVGHRGVNEDQEVHIVQNVTDPRDIAR